MTDWLTEWWFWIQSYTDQISEHIKLLIIQLFCSTVFSYNSVFYKGSPEILEVLYAPTMDMKDESLWTTVTNGGNRSEWQHHLSLGAFLRLRRSIWAVGPQTVAQCGPSLSLFSVYGDGSSRAHLGLMGPGENSEKWKQPGPEFKFNLDPRILWQNHP